MRHESAFKRQARLMSGESASAKSADFSSGKNAEEPLIKTKLKKKTNSPGYTFPTRLMQLVSRIRTFHGAKKEAKLKIKSNSRGKPEDINSVATDDMSSQGTAPTLHYRPVKSSANVISTGFQDRLEERKRSERTRIIKQFGVLGATVIFSLILIWILLFSSALAYQTGKTTISGANGEIDKAAIGRLLNVYQDTPLLRISTSALETEIAKTSTWIEKVEVSRAFPHGLEIKITAAQPVAIYGKKQLLSKEGKILDAKNIPADFPQIVSHCTIDRNEKCLKFAIQVLSLLPPDLSKRLHNVEINQSASLNLYFSDKKYVIWGTEEHNQEKLKILKIIINEPGRIYDLSNYSTPSIKQ